LGYSRVEEFSKMRVDSSACAHNTTALPRTCLVSLVVRFTNVTPLALLLPLSTSIWLTIASVIKVRNYDEALAMANDTPFGLSSGIVTTSLKHASHFKRNTQSGLVMVNLPTAGLDYHVPFGGRKKSSYGPREQGTYAKEFYTIVKTAYIAP